jgi:hypothetical protein
MTAIFKFIFPVIWTAAFGTGAAAMIAAGRKGKEGIALIIVLIAGALFIYWGFIRLKKVSMDDQFLYISNFRKEIKVHRSEIAKVTENVYINTHPVWIHFKRTTEFGDYVMFMPTSRPFAFFSSHPIVEELRKKVGMG